MSAQPASLDLRPEHYKTITKNNKSSEKTDDMAALCQLPKELDFGICGCAERRGAQAISTKVLNEQEDGKPAITLTTYKHDLKMRRSSDSLFRPLKPIDLSPFVRTWAPSFDSISSDTNRSKCQALEDGERPGLAQLRCQLEHHFHGLKSEFEEKTGRSWSPLRPWAKEEWNWEWESDEDEEAGCWTR